MRYLIFLAIAAVNLIFTATVFPNLNFAGLAPDIIICTMISMVILEKRFSGAFFGLACGLALDVMFTGAIGFYALPYFVTGAVAFTVSVRLRYVDKHMVPGCFAVGAFICKELIRALLAYMMSFHFSLWHMITRYILPEALLTGLLMLLIHIIMRRLYRSVAIRPSSMADLKRVM